MWSLVLGPLFVPYMLKNRSGTPWNNEWAIHTCSNTCAQTFDHDIWRLALQQGAAGPRELPILRYLFKFVILSISVRNIRNWMLVFFFLWNYAIYLNDKWCQQIWMISLASIWCWSLYQRWATVSHIIRLLHSLKPVAVGGMLYMPRNFLTWSLVIG